MSRLKAEKREGYRRPPALAFGDFGGVCSSVRHLCLKRYKEGLGGGPLQKLKHCCKLKYRAKDN